ncbi:N-acetylneuraminate synthase family protein [Hydrogenophilus thiooxidans]|uniref:N-acetylneuraminate synthase family protein n=1 Tax=Hydrogenophilus thiooxidans TaxID=2820326 RepID=UPI001C21026F|nr:N-acetylneuraminate synthase family protein [Hydrogenophilus thiooxidans]
MNRQELLLSAIRGKEEADIAIIGKGRSVDNISREALDGMIVINANDSEAIFPGDIGVFHHGWVLDRFELHPPKCKIYVTDRAMPAGTCVIPAQYAPYSEESELFVSRFFDVDTIWLEQAAVISCLRVANELAKALGKRKRTFLLGFDFSLDDGFSVRIENGLHGADDTYVACLIKTQEIYLECLLNERDKLFIDIIHVGKRPYSIYTVEAFNALKAPQCSIVAANEKGDLAFNRVLIVAEITTNHFGDRERLAAMIRLAKQAGADFIKLQKRDVDTFYDFETLSRPYKSPFGTTFRDYRYGLELSRDDFEWVDSYCRRLGIGWFASILDEPSFNFIKPFNLELIKLPSTISEKKSFLRKVASEWDKGLVISTGMTGPEYETFILEQFQKASHIYLLQCTSAYPTPEHHAGIGVISHYRELATRDPRIIPGYSSHDIGFLCSQLAVAAGAKMIEKHVKLGTVQWAHFDEVALDLATGEFEAFVKAVRRAERIVGNEEKVIFPSEHHKY